MLNTSLRFDPDSEIIFNEGYSAVLSVSNENNQTMVCKIEAKVEDYYHISPSFFFLRSSETVFVKIEMDRNDDDDADDDDDCSDHELIVNWLPIDEENLPDDAENYWKKNLKSRRKEVISRCFGCEFKNQSTLNVHNIEIISSDNQTFQSTEIDKNIQRLGKIAMDSHTTVAELNSEFDALIETMEATGVQQLSEIIVALRGISLDYRHLERKTRSAVSRTAYVVSEVARTASSKKLKPDEKITLMKRDFSSLSREFDTLSRCHTDISEQLATQAEKAEAAKEENDLRVKKAEEMKEDAQMCGMMGTPVIGLATSIANCSKMAVDSVDHSALKILVGIGGALGGVLVGTVVTAGSPILLAIAAALAITSKLWSTTFENMHDMIRQLEQMMDQAAGNLSDIDSNLNALDEQIKQVDPNENTRVLNEEFRRIQRMCEKVSEICTKYEELADSKPKRVRRLTEQN